jgi:hypothetical protein
MVDVEEPEKASDVEIVDLDELLLEEDQVEDDGEGDVD